MYEEQVTVIEREIGVLNSNICSKINVGARFKRHVLEGGKIFSGLFLCNRGQNKDTFRRQPLSHF